MNKLIALWLTLAVICVVLFCFMDADAYTHDSDVDPTQFFTYEPVLVEQLS